MSVLFGWNGSCGIKQGELQQTNEAAYGQLRASYEELLSPGFVLWDIRIDRFKALFHFETFSLSQDMVNRVSISVLQTYLHRTERVGC